MRTELWAMALLMVPLGAAQRGAVSGVAVAKAPAQVGVAVDITVTGRNPCGAVRIDPGDGTEPVTHAIVDVPTTVRHVYRTGGRFQLRAEGMGNCDGVAATTVQVNAAPPPPPAAPAPVVPAPGPRDDFDDVIVKAAERWTNTGLVVRRGDRIRIDSSGTVQLSTDAADTSGPGDAGSGRRALSAPLPERPAGGLIARIGNSRPLFVGGDSSFRATASGQLYLGVNDDHVADNRGEFRVRVAVPPRGRSRR